ncbi:signal peptidase I [uncultured Dokdonia sp.]|uniref:signal peptidase I n=1 Tax=uncultured Dokdonia sp. TaxID=575653 RepID=UPI00260D45A9|nr:signal peptidase I [uncultured Dokdonia sp.]
MSKKKKILLGIAIVFFGLLISYQFVGYKGYLKVYNIPTTSSSPTLEPGDYIIVSNLVPAQRNDFIIFKRLDENFGLANYVSRMIAKQGDTLSIKNGTAYVNGINIDKDIRLKHSYIINDNQLKSIQHILLSDYDNYYRIGENKIMIHLEDSVVKKFIPEATLTYTTTTKENQNNVHESFSKDWNSYNFGPLIISGNKFFVMGDNRDNTLDSRFIGLIDQNNYVGNAINVH